MRRGFFMRNTHARCCPGFRLETLSDESIEGERGIVEDRPGRVA